MMICALIVFSIQTVIAMPNLSPQDLYKASEMVFYGQVISKQAGPGPDYYYYQVKVQTFFKNSQTSDSITVAGHKPSEGHVTYPQFEIGDKAIFYINKTDGINTISPYSQKAGDACDVHSFLGPEYFGSLGNYHGGPASNPRITDINGNALEMIFTNQEIVLSYDDVWNNYPESRTIPVSILIQNEDNGKQIFNKTQNLEVQACSFAGTLKWNFVPTEIGNYIAKIDIDNKTKISMIFKAIYDSTKSQITLSPLKQLKSGIASLDVKCKQDLQLIFKSEDNSPACVKTYTAFRLSALGWGYLPSPFIIKKDLLNSTISGGKIKEFQYDPQSASIIIKIQTVSDGSLIITIPKIITDLNSSHKPFKDFHTVLVDGMEENIDLVPTANGSSFTIPFTNGTQEIEIIGNQVGQQN